LKAAGGIAISASHNGNEWNGLKLLNDEGEFLTPEQNAKMLKTLDQPLTSHKPWNELGKLTYSGYGLKDHVDAVLAMKYIDVKSIRKRKFKVLLDCVNGAGTYVMPDLLKELGCHVIEMNCERTGIFPRSPEPVPENLIETMKAVKDNDADIGIVVDPDVDRLVLVNEKGEPFGEEYTITQAVKYILSKEKGNVVVNLSTTRAVEDIAKEFGCKVFRAPVGEANVVKKMKEVDAIIGGEGSGGVIYPALQYARDALVGTVITLQHLLEFKGKMSEMKDSLPSYVIAKRKIEIGSKNPDLIISKLIEKYSGQTMNTDDGLRIDFPDHWVHFRKSNTEPIIRCIAEAKDENLVNSYIEKYMAEITSIN
jgi:phosphomannomutase